MHNLTYRTNVDSLDFVNLLVEYDYFDADPSVGLDATIDWFAYTAEAYPEMPVGTDVTYELSRADQKHIEAQLYKHYQQTLEDLHNDI